MRRRICIDCLERFKTLEVTFADQDFTLLLQPKVAALTASIQKVAADAQKLLDAIAFLSATDSGT